MSNPPQRLEMTRFATLWVVNCQFERKHQNGIEVREPLQASAPANARVSCSSWDITFWSADGNQELERVQCHRNREGSAPELWLVNGEWWEVGGGQVRFQGGRWWIIREGWRNTRTAVMANAGWHYYRSGVRAGRWPWLLWDRVCTTIHNAWRKLRQKREVAA